MISLTDCDFNSKALSPIIMNSEHIILNKPQRQISTYPAAQTKPQRKNSLGGITTRELHSNLIQYNKVPRKTVQSKTILTKIFDLFRKVK